MNLKPQDSKEWIQEHSYGYKAHLEQILIFLNYNENPNLTDFFGTSLLHFAVTDTQDNFEIVDKLIIAGADINAQNNCKQTPLHLAVLRQNWRIIEVLTSYGADVNMKEIKGNTALHFALNLLGIKRKDKKEACSWIIKKLLLCGADPNVSNNSGETPLTIAVKYGDLSTVQNLLAFGATVHYRNSNAETCLHLHSRCPKPEVSILEELVKYGACVNCCDASGRTALEILLKYHKIGNGIQLTKSLIKIATLVNWKNGMIFQINQNIEETGILEEFIVKCFQEVSQMKASVFSDEATLCHFALQGRNDGEKRKTCSVFDEVLDALMKYDFPIYGDLIQSHFDRTFLEEKLFLMNIYARNGKGPIRLHYFVISEIITYLSCQDLLNLVKAYSKDFQIANDK